MLLLTLSVVLHFGPATSAPTETVPTQRSLFKQAWALARNGDDAAVEPLRARLHDYPLLPYLDYALLEVQGANASEQAIKGFLLNYSELPLAGLLSDSWVAARAREGDSSVFASWPLPSRPSQSLRCLYTAWLMQENRLAEARDQVMALWLTGSSVSDSCDPVFKQGAALGWIDTDAYDERLRLAAKTGNQALARYLAPKASAAAQHAYQQFIVDLSADTIKTQLANGLSSQQIDWLELALMREIRNDPKVAQPLVAQALGSPYLEQATRNRLGRDLAVFLAADHHVESLGVFAVLPPPAFDHSAVEWHARGALVADDWALLGSLIQRMPNEVAADERWRFWLAESQHRTAGTDTSFSDLAKESNFFGFLAAERLNQPYMLCQSRRPLEPETLAQVLVNDGVRRALELYHVGLLHFARLEWSRSVRSMPASFRVQAALLAGQEGWHEKAISGLSSPLRRSLYRDRFPVVHRELFEASARQFGLDADILIAIARAESALTPDAVSRAGAQGLMQLMPATARRLAGPHGISLDGENPLFDPETNIQLGALHLAELVDRFNHPVLALAAYNAGPEAVERWWGRFQPDDPLIFLEAIPYRETREYVSRVLAFATIYQWRRTGQAGAIGSWLPPVSKAVGFPSGRPVEVRCPETLVAP